MAKKETRRKKASEKELIKEADRLERLRVRFSELNNLAGKINAAATFWTVSAVLNNGPYTDLDSVSCVAAIDRGAMQGINALQLNLIGQHGEVKVSLALPLEVDGSWNSRPPASHELSCFVEEALRDVLNGTIPAMLPSDSNACQHAIVEGIWSPPIRALREAAEAEDEPIHCDFRCIALVGSNLQHLMPTLREAGNMLVSPRIRELIWPDSDVFHPVGDSTWHNEFLWFGFCLDSLVKWHTQWNIGLQGPFRWGLGHEVVPMPELFPAAVPISSSTARSAEIHLIDFGLYAYVRSLIELSHVAMGHLLGIVTDSLGIQSGSPASNEHIQFDTVDDLNCAIPRIDDCPDDWIWSHQLGDFGLNKRSERPWSKLAAEYRAKGIGDSEFKLCKTLLICRRTPTGRWLFWKHSTPKLRHSDANIKKIMDGAARLFSATSVGSSAE